MVQEWLERPVNGSIEALERGLSDTRSYEDEVESAVEEKLGHRNNDCFRGLRTDRYRFSGDTKLALIIAEGNHARRRQPVADR